MDSKTSTTLSPELQATYDKIMGLNTSPVQATISPNQTKPEVEHVPKLTQTKEIQYPTATHEHRQISAFGNTHAPTIRGDAIGVFSPQNYSHSNHIILKILFIMGVMMLGGYIFLWLKFFNFPLPILSAPAS